MGTSRKYGQALQYDPMQEKFNYLTVFWDSVLLRHSACPIEHSNLQRGSRRSHTYTKESRSENLGCPCYHRSASSLCSWPDEDGYFPLTFLAWFMHRFQVLSQLLILHGAVPCGNSAAKSQWFAPCICQHGYTAHPPIRLHISSSHLC